MKHKIFDKCKILPYITQRIVRLLHRLMVGQRILTPSILVRVQVKQPKHSKALIFQVHRQSMGQE